MRNDNSLPTDDFSDAQTYWSSVRSSLKEKSDHNKRESQLCFFVVILFSLCAPLFIAFGQGFLFGKIVPSVLAVGGAAITAWLQLRQPQKLWAIYRRGQRELEDEKVKFDHSLAHYSDIKGKEKILAERTAKIAMDVHKRWEGLVPDADGLGAIARKGSKIEE